MLGIFKRKAQPPTNARPVKPVEKLAVKEAKWGSHEDATISELEDLVSEGWVCKWVGKTSLGVDAGKVWLFYGERPLVACVPVLEQQSVSMGGAACPAIETTRLPGEKLVVEMDSLHVYKGIVEWSVKWRC